MATIDPKDGSLIFHVVYDGIPFSGKTESIKALGRVLDRPVTTPDEDDGRTLFFDWLEYEGGLRMGRPIRCRVIAVPGQDALVGRRSTILAAADVVIFVFDSSPEGFARSIDHFRDLQRRLSTRERKIPVLIQVNKQDVTGAVPPSVVLDNIGSGYRSFPTVATEAQGVRAAFVLSVGEALRSLESAEKLYSQGDSFTTQELSIPSPEELSRILQEVGGPAESR